MSFHFPLSIVERGAATPAQQQERLVIGTTPQEVREPNIRIVNFLKQMVDATISGAQLFSSLYDPGKWRR